MWWTRFLKNQNLSVRFLLGVLLFPLRGAARKDNVSSDIPAHRPVLIAPPSSPGFFYTARWDGEADCRNGCVTSVMWLKQWSVLPTNFDRERSNCGTRKTEVGESKWFFHQEVRRGWGALHWHSWILRTRTSPAFRCRDTDSVRYH